MNEKKRTRHIVNALLFYCLENDITSVQLDISYEETQLSLQLQGISKKLPANINEFLDLLNTPRDTSIEGYYDELLGSGKETLNAQDYRLLGMALDHVEMTYEDQSFQLNLTRFFH
ncbi:MAG TPA: hypothetical protein H9829_07585 [Candidatus Tetragenococcus pullicola]|nr:hypothetical protein [Candidatus Tetragenococcus pullicola]